MSAASEPAVNQSRRFDMAISDEDPTSFEMPTARECERELALASPSWQANFPYPCRRSRPQLGRRP